MSSTRGPSSPTVSTCSDPPACGIARASYGTYDQRDDGRTRRPGQGRQAPGCAGDLMSSYETEHAEQERPSRPAQQPSPELSSSQRLASAVGNQAFSALARQGAGI